MGNAQLYKAAKDNDIETIRQCLDHGVNPNQKGKNGRTAVMRAVENGNYSMVVLLIDHGADLNQSDDMGNTPILLASRKGNEEILKVLIKKGADINAQDKLGRSALDYACLERKTAIVEILIENYANESNSSAKKWINTYPSVKDAYQNGIKKRNSTKHDVKCIDQTQSDDSSSNSVSPTVYYVDDDDDNKIQASSNEAKKHNDVNQNKSLIVASKIATSKLTLPASVLETKRSKENMFFQDDDKPLRQSSTATNPLVDNPIPAELLPHVNDRRSKDTSKESSLFMKPLIPPTYAVNAPMIVMDSTTKNNDYSNSTRYNLSNKRDNNEQDNNYYNKDEIKDPEDFFNDSYAFPTIVVNAVHVQSSAVSNSDKQEFLDEQSIKEKLESDISSPINLKTNDAAKLSEIAVGGITAVLKVASCIPVVTPIAKLFIELIELCDHSRCNKQSFIKLKERLVRFYELYFSKDGICDKEDPKKFTHIFHNLNQILNNAINILSGYTRAGWISKLLTTYKWKYEFETIDKEITSCLQEINTILNLKHIKNHDENYEILKDIQIKIEEQGLLGLNLTSQESEQLGIENKNEFHKEVKLYTEQITEQIEILNDKNVQRNDELINELQDLKKEIKSLLQNQTHNSNYNNQLTKEDSRILQCFKPIEEPEYSNELLGIGTFGRVFKGTYMDQDVAIKVPTFIDPNFMKEIRIHLKLNSFPGIVQIKAISLEQTMQRQPCIIMEMAKCSLADAIHKNALSTGLPLLIKLNLFLQVVSALNFISSAGVIHRDIKPSNVLLFFQASSSSSSSYKQTQQNQMMIAKICDFGLAKFSLDNTSTNITDHAKGTIVYMAPELNEQPVRYSVQSDIYALAVTLNEVLTEEKPYKNEVFFQPHLTKRPKVYKLDSDSGNKLRKLIEISWNKDQFKRPSFSTMYEELKTIFNIVVEESKYGSRR